MSHAEQLLRTARGRQGHAAVPGSTRVLRRRRGPNRVRVTGTCPVCGIPFILAADRSLLPHGPNGVPRCLGTGLRIQPDRYPTPLAAIRAAEDRLRIPEWRLLPLQACEADR